MSEKEKEEVIIDHSTHHHPLILTKSTSINGTDHYCHGCRKYIFSGEMIYRCRKECSHLTLHEACAEMPPEITFSLHPQHTLVQGDKSPLDTFECAVCGDEMSGIGYYCSSSDSCNFRIHLGCAHTMDVMAAAASSCTKHPSHPHHDLTLLWKPGRAASLRCDACGAIHRGNSYFCTLCQYCISQSCAALPATLDRHHLHDHPLSLAYRLPLEYLKYDFKCDVCLKELLPRYWVYHCPICRFVAHINCVISMSNMNVNAKVNVFPIKDAAEELIGPFVAKLGVTTISHDNEIIKGSYKFHNPNHQLRLTSSSLHDPEENDHVVDDDDDEEDDADLNYGLKGKLVCDGCTTPISSSNKYYISCGECKYFLHLSCFQLPQELPSHPLHADFLDSLSLEAPPKLDFVRCDICGFHTNGLFYHCTAWCNFRVDIKCASLPDTIQHVAHPHHHLNLVAPEIPKEHSYLHGCSACGYNAYKEAYYKCDHCQIILHARCAMLPPQVSNRRWDKHVLPLTYNASINHPSSFYCEVCEEEMNPKSWMYHCSECDVSIHPKCLPTTSGEFRNIKFGQRYDLGALHHHHVAHQLTNRLRCSVCEKRKVYGSRGFQCVSHKCDFFMCLDHCRQKDKHVMHAID